VSVAEPNRDSGGTFEFAEGRGAIDAAEAAVEGLPGAVSLAPGSPMPALGGELVLAPSPPGAPARAPGGRAGDEAADTVRAGIVQAGPLAVAGLVANAANVIVTILLARLLTTRGYGELNQLTGLFLIVSMPGSAVIVAVVRRVTAWQSRGEGGVVGRWAARQHRRGTVVAVAAALVIAAISPWFSHVLGQDNPVAVFAVLVAGEVWILLSFDRGLLQAHQSYRLLAVNLLIEGGVRTAAVLVLVGAGLGVTGAALGMLGAELVTALHARVTATAAWPVVGAEGAAGAGALYPAAASAGEGPDRRDLVTDLLFALVALATIALLQNIDVIVVGRAAPGVSGSYAAVSVASKAIVFGAIVLGGYLLPEAAIRWRRGGHALRQLSVTLLLLGIPASALLVVALVLPDKLLSIVFSGRYLGAERAFAPLGLAMVFLSITVVLTMYLLAVGRRWITVVLVLGATAATVAVVAAGGAPRATARADLAVQAALAVVVAVGFTLVHRRRLGRSD
jgi:O-antigen/teichoic acid export membrane protein